LRQGYVTGRINQVTIEATLVRKDLSPNE